MIKERIAAANASVKPSDFEVRVGRLYRDGRFAQLLVYKTARLDMNLLDEFFGPEAWDVEYKIERVGENHCAVKAVLRVRDGECVVVREGLSLAVLGDSNDLKAAESDALKRAGFALGLCRFLYDLPSVFVELDAGESDRVNAAGYFRVASLSPLRIVDRYGRVRFESKWEP